MIRLSSVLAVLLCLAASLFAEENPDVESPRMTEFLNEAKGTAKQLSRPAVQSKVFEIKTTLKLAEDRTKQVDQLAESLLEKIGERSREATKKYLLKQSPKDREQIMKQRGFRIGGENDDDAKDQAYWDAGVAKILTSEEIARLRNSDLDRKSHRTGALGQLGIALLDEKVAFTTEQRVLLKPIMEGLFAQVPSLYPSNSVNQPDSFTLNDFYAAAKKADEIAVRKILDEIQWDHWKRVVTTEIPNAAPTPPEFEKVEENPEPELTQEVISEFLGKKAAAAQEEKTAYMTLKAEDAVRVAGLSETVSGRLQSAAKGATEKNLTRWIQSVQSNVCGELTNADPRSVKLRLASIHEYYFRQSLDPAKEAVWTKTVETELSQEQRAQWRREVEARSNYRHDAIAAFLIAEFHRKFHLTSEQAGRLLPLLSNVLKKHSAALTSMFSSSSREPWYFQSHYSLLPLAGIPEEEFKKILLKDQWDTWTASSEYANGQSYWPHIEER